MDLQHPIAKAISVLAIFGYTLAPNEPSPPARGSATPPADGADALKDAPNRPRALAAAAAARERESSGVCPKGMLLVEGEYCPDSEQVCLKWLDPPPYQNLRCGAYQKPATCKGARQRRRFCIDREEYPEAGASRPEETLPLVGKNWGEAKALCEARGARLCKETEWEFACEGPAMSPYPYGWKRESGACNVDRTDLGGMGDKLKDHRAPPTAFPDCTSSFGVHHMTGNVDEWVEREASAPPYRSSLRGGWWLPGRNRCRAATLAHDESYHGKQVGFRCCKDAN